MRRLLRIARLALLSLAVLVVAAALALLGLRAYRQHVTAEAIAIHSAAGIDESSYVRIGGIDQWIRIRGQDRGNPVLLCLHGGPGGTWTPMTKLFVPWEKDFTVVQWDQRGAGKTLETTGDAIADTMTIERMAQDGIEVAEYLRTHLHKQKIVLLGHSWGSILGIRMIGKRPDLFHAYVGTGQVSSLPRSQQESYALLLERASRAHDGETLRGLREIGPPPFDRFDKVKRYFQAVDAYGHDREAMAKLGPVAFTAPDFSLRDLYYRFRGFSAVPPWRLYQAMLATDLATEQLDFEVPIYFFQGAGDDVTPPGLARAYIDAMRAPRKEMVLFEGSGHFAVWLQADRFGKELRARVKPRLPPDA